MSGDEIEELRAEIAQLLADALRVADETRIETERVQAVHHDELMWMGKLHDEEVANLERALETRDVIGQAKGITMVAMRCTAEHAFGLLIAQSQAENRKLVEIASEIAERTTRRARPSAGPG